MLRSQLYPGVRSEFIRFYNNIGSHLKKKIIFFLKTFYSGFVGDEFLLFNVNINLGVNIEIVRVTGQNDIAG